MQSEWKTSSIFGKNGCPVSGVLVKHCLKKLNDISSKCQSSLPMQSWIKGSRAIPFPRTITYSMTWSSITPLYYIYLGLYYCLITELNWVYTPPLFTDIGLYYCLIN